MTKTIGSIELELVPGLCCSMAPIHFCHHHNHHRSKGERHGSDLQGAFCPDRRLNPSEKVGIGFTLKSTLQESQHSGFSPHALLFALMCQHFDGAPVDDAWVSCLEFGGPVANSLWSFNRVRPLSLWWHCCMTPALTCEQEKHLLESCKSDAPIVISLLEAGY
jgi:hypothetical protein